MAQNKQFLLVLVLACFFSINVTYATSVESLKKSTSKPEILWLIEDNIENFNANINTGINKEKINSTSTYTEKLILSQLKGFNIEFQTVPAKRANYVIKNNNNVCVTSRIKNSKREQYSIFSTPQNLYLTYKLYRLANSTEPIPAEVFNNKGEIISLSALFSAQPNKLLTIADGISYGKFFDNEINKLRSKNVYSRSGVKRAEAISKMLTKKRIDYILYFPTVFNLIMNKETAIESYSIANAQPYILGHISCSKSKLGQQVIDKINIILHNAYQTEEFYQAHYQWIHPQDKKLLDQYYPEVFGVVPSELTH